MKKQNKTDFHRIPLHGSTGKHADTLELDKDIFNGKYSKPLLYHCVNMYRANQRKGTASTKTRADVRGGGKKPWRQKGTGRARVGSIRNPVWRGGGIAFGPHPRDFRYDLPKKMKRNALVSSINAKLKSGQVLAIESLSIEEPKTKKFTKLLKGLKLKNKTLFLVEKIDRNADLASRNVKNITMKSAQNATAMDVLSNDNIVLTRQAIEVLNKKAKK